MAGAADPGVGVRPAGGSVWIVRSRLITPVWSTVMDSIAMANNGVVGRGPGVAADAGDAVNVVRIDAVVSTNNKCRR